MPKVRIDNIFIGEGEPSFVIAEVAASHEGSFEQAKRLIEVSKEAGADAIKFQVFKADELLVSSHPKYQVFQELEFSPEQWSELLNFSGKLGISFLADVFDLPSLEMMDRPEVKGYKLHLTNIANPQMLSGIGKTGKPVFLATGGAKPEEIRTAIEALESDGNTGIILMHGYQAYPTRLEEVNLRMILKLKELFSLPVGFLDHVDGGTEMAIIVPNVALAFGACAIEKHITLDRSLKGQDYFSALDPPQFQLFVKYIRETEKTFGSTSFSFSPEEVKYRQEVMKNIVAAIPILKGTRLTPAMLTFKRATLGLSPMDAPDILGRAARFDIDKDEVITMEKLE
ncbi:N-acetylneuraminate synthase family protein [Chloroflexota bacterium]